MRRVEGRTVYLAETAVQVFEKEQRRTIDERTHGSARQHWLKLAGSVHAPSAAVSRLAAAPLTDEVVEASRTLYLSSAERAVRNARRAKKWDDVARIRRAQAATLLHEARGAPAPTEEVRQLHREGMLAELRAQARIARESEIVSTGCCAICRKDDGAVFPIAAELRSPRLPHEGCPKGLCGCEWWPAVRPKPVRKRRAKSSTAAKAPTTGQAGTEPQAIAPAEPETTATAEAS